jgi:hypothetical protein
VLSLKNNVSRSTGGDFLAALAGAMATDAARTIAVDSLVDTLFSFRKQFAVDADEGAPDEGAPRVDARDRAPRSQRRCRMVDGCGMVDGR